MRWDVHGSQRGNLVLADASVTQVGVKEDFETAGRNMFQDMYQSKAGNQMGGGAMGAQRFMLYSPF